MSLWRTLLSWTVFNKADFANMPLNELIAIYFHRTAATVYMIYSVWGVVSFVGYIPVLAHMVSPGFQDFFSLMIVPIAIAACVGATFFPKLARLEMFSAAALAMLVLIYLLIMTIAGLEGDVSRLTNSVLNTSHLVLPVARIALIVRSLLAAKQRSGESDD